MQSLFLLSFIFSHNFIKDLTLIKYFIIVLKIK